MSSTKNQGETRWGLSILIGMMLGLMVLNLAVPVFWLVDLAEGAGLWKIANGCWMIGALLLMVAYVLRPIDRCPDCQFPKMTRYDNGWWRCNRCHMHFSASEVG